LILISEAKNSFLEPLLLENTIKNNDLKRVKKQSASILVTNGFTARATASITGCSISTVSRSHRRMITSGDIKDLPRSGCTGIYSETFKLELIAFYCQTQPLPNSGRWTLRWAESHLSAHPKIVNAAPSKSTIHRILKENKLKPHLTRYFLNITDPDFFPKMYHLLKLYEHSPKNLFFFDECPGIQILKRLVPDLRTENTKKRLEEFEYIRNGTMNVLAFLNYANGKVYAKCRADHKTETFLEIFRNHVATCSATEEIHYVMDNLSTHRGYQFCKVVAELSNVKCPTEKELDNMEKRVNFFKSADKRIVIHFTPYHGSWLNLVEIWFGIMNKKVLSESYGSAEGLEEGFEAFIEEWNTLLSHPFRWSYDGKGLEEKAVIRFTQILKHSAKNLEIKTITKQMQLMVNIFEQYFTEIEKVNWDKLCSVLRDQEEIIRNNILNEKGPQKKEKAENALNSLFSPLVNSSI
jgi:transposase